MKLKELKEQIKEKGITKVIKERIDRTKSIPKACDSISWTYAKANTSTKQESEGDSDELRVKVVANMAMFCDSDMDVLSKSCWDKSIQERGTGDMIPFLNQHQHSLDGRIGKTVKFYNDKVDLKPLGYEGMGDALVHEAIVMRKLNEKVFTQYKEGMIKQHSIGLRYMQINLAVDDPEMEKEYELYNMLKDQIINFDKIQEKGYFWYVNEIKLIENSAVLFGSNSLTPTLETQAVDKTSKSTTETKSVFKSLVSRM